MKHEEIRLALAAGCSEEELKATRCPVCGDEVTLHVHPRRKMFFIRCNSDTTHLAIHGVSPSPPEWFAKYLEHDAWLS